MGEVTQGSTRISQDVGRDEESIGRSLYCVFHGKAKQGRKTV